MVTLGAILTGVLITFCARLLFKVSRSGIPAGAKPLPGPKGWPFIGNLLDVPPQHSWLKFKEWADEFGSIYQISIFGKKHVIVSTEKIAKDLFSDRGSIYSDREVTPMASTLVGGGMTFVLLPFGDRLKRWRKFVHKQVGGTAANKYRPVQLFESKRLLYDLIRDPDNYENWVQRFSAGFSIRVGFGKVIKTGQESDILTLIDILRELERCASPGAYLVDSLPILMYLPEWLAPFKREGRKLQERERKFYLALQSEVQDQIDKGIAPPSFSRNFLENQESHDLSYTEGAHVLGSMYEAGAGTVAAAVLSMILAMCHYPEWLRKLQDEVDRVVGNDRMPNFEDMPNLPLVRAFYKETLRWRPVTAGGVPHRLSKDDIYEGYFIPEGANVHGNIWAVHREKKFYPDPETFNPERWLSPDYPTYREPLTVYPNIQGYSAFSFGRRQCPGSVVAENSLFMETACIAWGCNITLKKDAQGHDIGVPLYDYVSGFNTQPKKFPFHLSVRSTNKENIIADEWIDSKIKSLEII